MVLKLKGLDDVVSVIVVRPFLDEAIGWTFRGETDTPGKKEVAGTTPDTVNGFMTVRELYVQNDPDYQGTVCSYTHMQRSSGVLTTQLN